MRERDLTFEIRIVERILVVGVTCILCRRATALEESPPRVTALLDMSLVETILDDASGALVAGQAGVKVRRRQYWTFDWDDSAWVLADVEQPDAGARHLNAPLVGGDFASLSPEMILRERYARGEIELDEFEREMAALLQREPTN